MLSPELYSVATNYMVYLAEHGKSYITNEEFAARKDLWAETEAFIKEHNSLIGRKFTVGHNKMSDWTEYERTQILGYRPPQDEEPETWLEPTNADSVDWRTKGAVTPVKDQGQCGSCWTFSSTGALEGAHAIATGELLSFSEQQIVDCANVKHGYVSFGCNGGNQSVAFKYLEKHNAELETVYKYTAKNGSCAYDKASTTAVDVSTYTNVTKNNVSQMKTAVAQQPVSVSIEADKRVFQQYTSGIFDSADCGTKLDHAVLVVGYGSDNGTDYWIMKNSWGTVWGDQGYMKVQIEDGAGICGIQMGPLFPSSN
jgi:C1A family cysteine protease